MNIRCEKKTPPPPEELGPRAVGKGRTTPDNPDSEPLWSTFPTKKRSIKEKPNCAHPDSPFVIIDSDDDVPDLREQEKPFLETNYASVVTEAILTLDKPNGSCFNDIAEFIEQKYQVPQNFETVLSDLLTGLIGHRKLDKAHSLFKIAGESVETSPPQLLEGKYDEEGPFQASGSIASARASAATYCTVKAEDMESFAAEAVKEYERITQIFKDTGSTLEVAKYIYENCPTIQAMDP